MAHEREKGGGLGWRGGEGDKKNFERVTRLVLHLPVGL
jgi:hypothetical protein